MRDCYLKWLFKSLRHKLFRGQPKVKFWLSAETEPARNSTKSFTNSEITLLQNICCGQKRYVSLGKLFAESFEMSLKFGRSLLRPLSLSAQSKQIGPIKESGQAEETARKWYYEFILDLADKVSTCTCAIHKLMKQFVKRGPHLRMQDKVITHMH